VTVIGKVSVAASLYWHGVRDVLADEPESALHALDSLTTGIFVQGMGSAEPRIGSDAGHEFRQRDSERHSAGALSFAGICVTRFVRSRRDTQCTVTGEPEYRLEIRAGQSHGSPAEVGHALASLGGLMLIGTSISTDESLRGRLEPSRS
jgi:hypothetical protein